MRRIVLFEHVSVDGFVGGPKGNLDWIYLDDSIFDLATRQTEIADTALYGRVTFQMMHDYWPTAADKPNATKHDVEHSEWYNNVRKVVISKTLSEENYTNTTFIRNNISTEIQNLKNQPGKNILMFGSPTAAHTLMRNNLIDDYWLLVNPVFLGSGIALFKDILKRIDLKLADNIVFDSGVVCLHYAKR